MALLPRYGITVVPDRSGVYSYATARAVNRLRHAYRLPEDGTVTNELFLKMQRDYENPPRIDSALNSMSAVRQE